MRALGAALLVSVAALAAGAPAPARADPQPLAPLADVQTIALPGVERRIDHFAVDPAGKRLFVAALGNHTLEVLDVGAGTRVKSIGGLKEPQGVAYLPALHEIVVAMRGGSIAAFDDVKYERTATLANTGDADNLRWDAAAGELWVGYGDGALGRLDPSSMKLVASVPLAGHPESFRPEESGPRIYANVPPAKEIVVVDRKQRAIVMHIPLGGAADNYPMALDEAGHRLFVGVRRPAELLVFDTTTGKRLAGVPCAGDTDDLFYDAKRARVYVIGGEGFVDVFDGAPSGKYDRLARLSTRAGARTGLWSSDLDRLYVAWPSREGRAAEIHVLAPPSP